MRLLLGMAITLLAGCHGTAPERPASKPEVHVGAPQPARFEIKQGTPVEIGGGVRVTLESALYAHLSGSRNSALLQLTVTRDHQSEKVTLDRLYPGPPKYQEVFGLKLAIDYVDPYHQPSTGALFVIAGD